MVNMIYHPAIIILLFLVMLIFSYHRDHIFASIALLMPVIAGYVMYIAPEIQIIDLKKISLICECNEYNKLIGTSFLLVLFTTNLYAIGKDKKKEVILGSGYAASALLCLFAGDFLSMLVGIELMMLMSSLIIFVGDMRSSLRFAKKYFLTHLISGTMIMLGIAYLFTKNNNLELILITELLDNPEYSSTILLT